MNNQTVEFRTDIRLHETLSIAGKIRKDVADEIALYCKELADYLRKKKDKPEIKATLTLNGVSAELSNKKSFFDFLENIYTADSLDFDVFFDGFFCHPYGGETGFWCKACFKDSVDNLNYKCLRYNYEHNYVTFDKIENGKTVDINSLMNKEYPLTVNDTSSWKSVDLYMGYYRDDITDEQAEKIQSIVRKYLPEDQIENCESDWEDCNDVVLTCVEWVPENFKKVSDFLDELNEVVVLPEEDRNKNKIEPDEYSTWYDMKNFAVVFFSEVDGKFVLFGTDF